jgi:2-dehydropantoate 2-reductase
MTDLVVGGGAVGTLIAWALAIGGRDVAVVRRRHAGPPAAAQLTATDPTGGVSSVTVTEVREPADVSAAPELIVFAVKMYDLEAAAASCAMWPEAVGLTVGNGIGAEEIVTSVRQGAPHIAGSVTASVELREERHVARLNRGGVAVAPFAGSADHAVADLAATFTVAGLAASAESDARAMKWSKLLTNLVANATSAILDMSAAEIYASAEGYGVERRQLREALAVMRALGLRPVKLPGVDARLLALAARAPAVIAQPILTRVVGRARGGKEPSLRLHAQSDPGRSEVEWLNGAVVRAARDLGRRAPVNECLARLLDEVLRQPERRGWFHGRPDRLAETCSGGS